MLPDPLAALRTYLLGRTVVTALVGDRVHVAEIPAGLTAAMPTAAVVLVAAGGLPLSRPPGSLRLDVFCYGATPQAADELRRTIYPVLDAIRQRVVAGVMLHSANPAGGPLSLRDPDAGWPVSFQSWQVLYGEQSAAA